MTFSGAPVDDVRAEAYRIPTDAPEADGTLAWSDTTIVVVTVRAGGVVGTGWTYAHHACVSFVDGALKPVVQGEDVLDVPAIWQRMQRAIRNHGRPGLVSCSMSAVETALWDAAARLLDVPLCRLLGRVRETVPIYGSGGFTTYDDEQLQQQLDRWVRDFGVPAVKIKIGEGRGTAVERDLARIDQAQRAVGPGVEVHVDANGAYSVAQAMRVGQRLDERDVRWFEEPVSSDDLTGLSEVRGTVATDVAAGEYGYDLPYFGAMLGADAVDCLQIDVTRCGGFGEWQRAAALANARNMPVSGHCAQNLAAHVAAATPNARHLEWFHDHERIEQSLFDGTLAPHDGAVRPDLSVAGHGMTFKTEQARRYRVV